MVNQKGGLAEIRRRLVEGARIQIVRHSWCKELTPELSKIRTVARVQTNAIAFKIEGKDGLSWLYWPKAKEVRTTENGFEVCLSEDGSFRESMAYEWR